MKKLSALLYLSFFSISVFAQKAPAVVNPYAAIDKKALLLPDSLRATTTAIAGYITNNFHSDQEKTRAIFTWVATNIRYDVDNMFALDFYEKPEEKITKPLKTGKGICENYAALFTDICSKSGIRAYVIEGYTRQNGFTDFIPHAWCAAQVDGSWFLFDPTWGSGYMSNKQFVKRINNSYYKASPSVLIKSHMPFDPMWQFLNYTVSSKEFYDEVIQPDKSKTYFSFTDSIQAYEQLSRIEQFASASGRIERNGVKNSLVYDRLQHIKRELEHLRQSEVVDLYNTAGVDYNESINQYNEFINYWNKQFTPKRSDPEIRDMIDKPLAKLQQAREKLAKIKDPDASTAALILQMKRSINEAETQVKEKEVWLQEYFSKGKAGRKSMFFTRKVSWFGIPLN